MKSFFGIGSVLLAVAFISVMTMSGAAFAADTINGAGASFPYPVYSAWAYEYNNVAGVQVNYQSIGSGGGQRQIASRTVDFGASDAPLTPETLDEKKLLQFPAVVGGVIPVVNIKGLKPGDLKLDAPALCGIMLGDINTWSDPAIASLNKDLKLPEGNITVVHRSDGSGTTAVFTTYLSGACPNWKSRVGAGKAVKWPVGIGGKGNEGVSNYVKRSKNSIGYVEFAYAKQNKLAWTQLKNPAGIFVEPGFESFKEAAATGDFDPGKHFNLWLTNAPGKKAWPIAGATFILLAREKTGVNQKVIRFFDWAYSNGDKTAERLVYVPLPESLKGKVRAYWKKHGI